MVSMTFNKHYSDSCKDHETMVDISLEKLGVGKHACKRVGLLLLAGVACMTKIMFGVRV